jgi:hypothetical protein
MEPMRVWLRKIRSWQELKHRFLAKEHHMRIFFNSENYFMINMEIIRSDISTRWGMRRKHSRDHVDELVETWENHKMTATSLEPNGYTV